MAQQESVDAEALRSDLERIKDAMGLKERYPSQFVLWLVYAVLVLVAAIGSQLVVLRGWSGIWHPVIWFVLMGLGGLYGSRRGREHATTTTRGLKPNILLQWGAVAALYLVFALGLSPVLTGVSDQLATATIFSLVVGLVGAAYLVAGESLKAYNIRRRDRWAFHVGGLWMLAFAAVMPNVGALREWGYAVYGLLYAAYGVVTYVVLAR